MDNLRERGHFPGAVVGIWGPKGTWVGTTGTLGLNGGTLTREAHTRIASVSKTIVVTEVLILHDRGKLNIDDPIGKYVPDVPNPTATLRQLASMTSGIASHTNLEDFNKAFNANPTKIWSRGEILNWIKRAGASFAPGTGYEYSNANTFLLGMVLEKVTGKPLGTLLDQDIFTPLGMSQTSMPTTNAIPAPAMLGVTDKGVYGAPVVDASTWSPSYVWAAGQIISTVDDLHIWADALLDGRLLKPETQKMRLASLDLNQKTGLDTFQYGLGIGRDHGWVGHSGELDGYTTMVRKDPVTQTVLIVLVASSAYIDFDRPATRLFDLLKPLVV